VLISLFQEVEAMRIYRPTAALVLTALALLLSSSSLCAQEFSFHEPGARAAALGGAFTARADDAAALFYNPAGLAFLEGVRVKTNLIFGHRTLKAVWPENNLTMHSNPNEILGAHALAWQPVKRLTISTGLFSPYTYHALWSPSFSVYSDCVKSSLQATYFRSALAVEIFKGFAVSGGVDLVSTKLEWKHNVPLTAVTYAESRHRLHGHGVGFAAGVLWKIIPAIQVGARFHKNVTVDLAGDTIRVIHFTGQPYNLSAANSGTLAAPEPINIFQSQAVVGQLTVPREIAVGAALTPFSRLSLYVDVQWDRWRDFGDWIFYPAEEGSDPDYGIQGVPLTLMDTTNFKAGLEYRPSGHIAVRTGYTHLASAVDAAHRTLVYPDLERNVFALGIGYEGPLFSIYGGDERISDLSFDAVVRYAPAVPAASTYPGYELSYNSSRVVFTVGVGFGF
jgi:long-chain fatty acid transport protein